MVENVQAVPLPTLEAALAAFGDFPNPRFTPLGSGLIHQTWSVSAGSDELILQRVNAVFGPGVHRNIAAVTRHLLEKGCTTFRLVPSRTGEAVARLADDDWRLITRIPGVAFDRCDGPGQARAAGALVAGFHAALADFDAPLEPLGFPFHEPALHVRALRNALERHGDHPLHADVAGIAGEILPRWERWTPPADLPRRVIHGDLKFNNLLFAGTGAAARLEAVALIDLDTLARMPLYFDWGDAWRSWCNRRPEDDPEAELDLAIYEAAAEGMMEGLGFRPGGGELDSLAHALEQLSLELATRFATDALEEKHWSYDETRFERSGEHNLCRARGQLALHRQACESHEERARVLLR